jgi:uncharacterized protein (UPF0332 family)
VTEEGRREASAEEIALAREELATARTLRNSGLLRIAVTRAYYAMFHAMRAALYAIDVEPATHTGTLHLFHQHFVRTGLHAASLGQLAPNLQRDREAADYKSSFAITEARLDAYLAEVSALVDAVAVTLPH